MRSTVLAADTLAIEHVRVSLDAPQSISWTAKRQILFTLAGRFTWHVGRTRTAIDPSRVMFVDWNEESVDSGAGEVECVIVTLGDALADELETLFVRRSAHVPVHSLARVQTGCEETALSLLRSLGEPAPIATHAAQGLARRAKSRLADHGELVRLTVLAKELGVSPAYLTDAFRRAEGVPLVRYQLDLRIRRALAELPHTNDLAALALELGFSSHSHFSTTFRAAVGVTPSEYRKNLKAAVAMRA